nr:hypothetical protein [Tanacetum cinerariifolium]
MTLTFADTHNMIAYLTKSDASEGFNQIFDFLNGSSIKYALTVNSNINVSCIKQFWTSVAVKKVNDVTRLQALVDKKKVVLTEATIRDAPRLDDAESDVSAADDVVLTVVEEPYIPSPTPPTPPPQPSQDIPSTSQDAGVSMDLLQNLLDTCTTLTRRVEHLEQDKVGTTQKIEASDDTVMDDVFKQWRMIADIDADVDVTLKDVATVTKDVQDAKIIESSDVQGRKAESQAQIYQIDLEYAEKLITEVVTATSATITSAAPQLNNADALTLTTAPSAARRRKGVVIKDPEETATPSIIIHTEVKSKDKGKGILVEEPKPLKKEAQIEQDGAYARELEAELNKNIN